MPKIIIHNSTSLDESIIGFEVNMGLHYQIAGGYKADAHLIGSNTAKAGIGMFLDKVPEETKSDFEKPGIKPDDNRAFWVIVDSKGTMKDLLHVMRGSEYCKDVIVLVSKKTPKAYIDYLKERDYDYIVTGDNHVDLEKGLEILNEKYKVEVVLTDTGTTLNSILLGKGLVDEISVLVHPVLTGNKEKKMFGGLNLEDGMKLELKDSKVFDDHVLMVYKVLK